MVAGIQFMLAVKTWRAWLSVSSEYQTEEPSAEAASQKEACSSRPSGRTPWVAKSKNSRVENFPVYSLRNRMPFLVSDQLAHVLGRISDESRLSSPPFTGISQISGFS